MQNKWKWPFAYSALLVVLWGAGTVPAFAEDLKAASPVVESDAVEAQEAPVAEATPEEAAPPGPDQADIAEVEVRTVDR